MSQGQGGGAPTKYDVKYNKQAYKLCLLGYTDKELADFFEVEESTINNWKIKHPRFLESMKKGKADADTNVVQSLYKRAMGYDYKEVSFEKIDGKEALEVTPDSIIATDQYKKKIVVKALAGDVTAAIFWLKNRQPKKWRDKQEVENTGNVVNYNVPLTKEEAVELDNWLESEFVKRKGNDIF